jgi:hypothetical protein
MKDTRAVPPVQEPTLLAIQSKGLYGGQRKADLGSNNAQSISSKWKEVLFAEGLSCFICFVLFDVILILGSLLDMDDPWAKKKEVKLEGLDKPVEATGAAQEEDGFDAVWNAKTQSKLAFACKHVFDRWDLNRDGTLDMDEFNACMSELCMRLGMPKVSFCFCVFLFVSFC